MTTERPLKSSHITARIAEKQNERLDEIARALGESRSTIVSRAIDEYIDRHAYRCCPSCGILTSTARFCPRCGTPIVPDARRELEDAVGECRAREIWERVLECAKKEIEEGGE